MLLEIDSIYLAKCIYNKRCDAGSTLNDFPAYVQPLGTLIIDEGNASIDNICDMITLKYWTSIEVLTQEKNANICYFYNEDLSISNYPYLKSLRFGNHAYKSVKNLTFESTIVYLFRLQTKIFPYLLLSKLALLHL